MPKLFAVLLAALLHSTSGAVEVRFEKVTEGVYAHIGELGGRTRENEAMNANIGLVTTDNPAGCGPD